MYFLIPSCVFIFLQSILFEHKFSLIYYSYPIDLCLLNLANTDITKNLNWLTVDENELYFIYSYLISLLVYQLYYLIFLNYIQWRTYNYKFLISNLSILYYPTLTYLVNIRSHNSFYFSFSYLIIINFILFWFPSLLFYFIYGPKLIHYREKYNFLIKDLTLKHKYFIFTYLFFKTLAGIFIIKKNNFILPILNILYFTIFYSRKPLKKFNKKTFILINIFSLVMLIINSFDIKFLLYINLSLFICLLILLLINLVIKDSNNLDANFELRQINVQ